MSRKVELALQLVYESLDELSYTDDPYTDKATDKLARAAAFLEGVISGEDDYVDPDDEDSVERYSLNFDRDDD